MIAAKLIQPDFVSLDAKLPLSEALQLFEQAQVFTLPIVDRRKQVLAYIGLDVLIASMNQPSLITLNDLQNDWLRLPVLPFNCHYFEMLRIFDMTQSDCLAIVDEQNTYLGYVTVQRLTAQAAALFSVKQTGAIIVLAVEASDFSLVELTRLIESHDVKIVGIELIESEVEGVLHIHLKLNSVYLREIIATLERFGYKLHAHFMRQDWEDDTEERYRLLMHYLED
jgi:acetoin utilization protein AcuB